MLILLTDLNYFAASVVPDWHIPDQNEDILDLFVVFQTEVKGEGLVFTCLNGARSLLC